MGCESCKQSAVEPEISEVHELKALSATAGTPKTLEFLSQVKLFKRLPEDQHNLLASACQPVDFAKGSVLIKQNDEGAEFFVIVSGTVSVLIDDKKVASLTGGDYFGENALLRNEPRNATITADSEVSTLKITRDKFQEMGLNEKLEFAKRQAIGGGAEREVATQPPTTKTPEERKRMIAALRDNKNLSTMATLDDAKCNAMVDIAWEEKVVAGQDIITQGNEDADYFYVIKSGAFNVLISNDGGKSAQKESRNSILGVGLKINQGGSFGELALLYFAPRAATVRADVDSVLWVIDRANFKAVLAKSGEDTAKEYVKYLDNAEFFNSLKPDEKLEVAKNLHEGTFSKGETIFEQGETGKVFYILHDGEVSVVKDGKEVAKPKGTAAKPAIFGERALLTAEARAATINVVSETAKTLYMDKSSFDMLLGPLEDIKNRGATGESKVGKVKAPPPKAAATGDTKILRKDLVQLGLLGCGGFGAVELVEHKVTKDTFALKSVSKGHIVKCGMKKSVVSEKNIQYMCNSPFIIKLHETYNSEQFLSLLLEVALGGELYATYSKKSFHGNVGHAKFYIAGTVESFEHLHSKKVIYRDLKPENLLLTESGAVKLTDMGLAKVVVGKTHTTCGTPDYFAPEVIQSLGHTCAVDWWTLGILLFELMAGHPPFEADAPIQTYSKVLAGINKVRFPPKLSKQAGEDLVKALCKKDPSDRLPMKKGAIDNVRKHPWYSGFDWKAFQDLTMDAPYKPKVKGKKDIANFNARKEDMPPQFKYRDDGTGWDKDFATST